MNDWKVWLSQTTGKASAADVASALRVHRVTVQRWMRLRPPCEVIFAVAREYDGDVIAGMMAAGYMTEEDFARSIDGGLARVPVERLWGEILRRTAR